jgi:4-diphosphocytidyl-2-C-methyl-D-erythritol kinase
MIVYPNAKINLGLHIVSKRTDGFHNIETCFYPIGLCDILEFVESDTATTFQSSGVKIPGNESDNLCIKAWKTLHDEFKIPAVKIHLHKQIPIGAGLGGGSSNAAFMLKGLNDYFELKIPSPKLEWYASQLGSDCAFFIRNTPSFASGRGEILTPIELNLNNYKILLINPGIHVGTKEAYSQVIPKIPDVKLSKSLALPIENWKDEISNDFESGVFQKHPEIGELKNSMLESGAVYAAMSGSGSSVFGIFRDTIPEKLRSTYNNMFCWYSK